MPTARRHLTTFALAVLCALGACVRRDYRCDTDADCDVGEAGRCELDHRCTAYDPRCETQRRYSDSAGPESGLCFDDSAMPINLCAAGQPPALPEGCVADVCASLPACCKTGWSSVCVQEAQLRCGDLSCDTRIALTATTSTGGTELWDLRWNGAAWSATRDAREHVLAWLAPAPGGTEPRLAGFTNGALVIDGVSIPVSSRDRNYRSITSVDFDRDGRDTVALGSYSLTDTKMFSPRVVITKLDGRLTPELIAVGADGLSWGDNEHDAFPDVLLADNHQGYSLTLNYEIGEGHARGITNGFELPIGPASPGPAVRSVDWIDLDGDHKLDVAAYGWEVNVHLSRGVQVSPQALRFCARHSGSPATPPFPCEAYEPRAAATPDQQAFAGAAMPAEPETKGGRLVIAPFDQRALYQVSIAPLPLGGFEPVATPYTFRDAATCAGCPPIIAVVVRDLDGDHKLDVVAIDGDLRVYVSRDGSSLQLEHQIAAAAGRFAEVRTSVSGAPRR